MFTAEAGRMVMGHLILVIAGRLRMSVHMSTLVIGETQHILNETFHPSIWEEFYFTFEQINILDVSKGFKCFWDFVIHGVRKNLFFMSQLLILTGLCVCASKF